MARSMVRLDIPAKAEFARSVRMMAANLAVVSGLTIDDIEDVRMAAEEGFVYACATLQDEVHILFVIDDERIEMSFSLGEEAPVDDAYDDGSFEYAKLILQGVTDEFSIDDGDHTLRVAKQMGGVGVE